MIKIGMWVGHARHCPRNTVKVRRSRSQSHATQ